MRGWHLCLLSVASAASAAAFHAPPNLPVAVPGNHQGLRPQCTLRHRAGLRLMLPSRRIGMGRRPSGLLTLALMTFREGDSVEVKWQGEWWPAAIQEVRMSPCGDDKTQAVEAVRVRFEGGSDEEWVKIASGDIRASGAMSSVGAAVTEDETLESVCQGTSDADYWLAAGPKSSDFTSSQQELLEELIEYRIQPGAKCLELGAGARSLIPVECVGSLFGIGLVAEHLQVNAMLTGFEVMDLNAPKLKLPFEDETFDAIVCNSLPYARDPAAVLGEACRCLNKAGVLVISWSGNSLHQDRMVSSWRKLTGSEQVGRVKELFAGAGLSGQSLRVDVSGPTEGAKLFVVSGSPTPPPQQERQQHAGAAQSWKAAGDGGEEMRVEDAVGPQQLLSALKDKSKKRLDARRQREHDEKPFRVKVVSPPPETLLDDTFYFHPRTHNGDKVTIFEDEYVVSRCKLTYSYRQGRYRLDAKILEVQKTSRYETNEKLNSLVKPSPSAPPPNPP